MFKAAAQPHQNSRQGQPQPKRHKKRWTSILWHTTKGRCRFPWCSHAAFRGLGNLLRAATASANYLQGEKSGLRAAEGDNLLAYTRLVAACDFLAVGDCSGEECCDVMNLLQPPKTRKTETTSQIPRFSGIPQDRFHSIQVPTVALFLLSVGCVRLRSVVQGSDFATRTYFFEFWGLSVACF